LLVADRTDLGVLEKLVDLSFKILSCNRLDPSLTWAIFKFFDVEAGLVERIGWVCKIHYKPPRAFVSALENFDVIAERRNCDWLFH
jgi:hypothetical protein